MAFAQITEAELKAIDKGLLVGSIFGTTDHQLVIHKLESYGITGRPLQFISSYLTNWTQVVQIDAKLSSAKFINQDIPQGSILGPLLFLLFINDLFNVLTIADCILYADDRTIFTCTNVDKLSEKLMLI